MSKLVIANWKMNKSLSDICCYVKVLKKNFKRADDIVVCVPATMICEFSKKAKNVCQTGAQNCHFAESGAYTGELTANMVKEAGASYVLIGHSERRHIFGETDELVAKKVKTALSAGLNVVLCVGETLEEKSKYKSVLKKQLLEGLSLVNNFDNLIIAYEPVWAIGTGKVASTSDIEKAHNYIKQVLAENFNTEARIFYGGSVKPSNSEEILGLEHVDGVLVGGACLNAEDFVKIINSRG